MTQPSIRNLVLILAPLALLTAACNGTSMGAGAAGDPVLGAHLTGAVEVPGPGDADGGGRVVVRFDPATPTRLCYELTVSSIAPASAAHIHRGAAGVAGPVVVPLEAPAGGSSSGCVDVAAPLATEIMTAPGGFYVNVHNEEFPNGAVRGQLEG